MSDLKTTRTYVNWHQRRWLVLDSQSGEMALYAQSPRAITEQEEQELAASVHAFAVRSRQTLTGDPTEPGVTCEA